MLSFSKILLLVAVIAAVWFGWRWIARVDAQRRAALNRRPAPSSKADPGRTAAAPPPRMEAEDMEKCPECGAYVAPRSAVSCGRPGCPYGR